MSLQIDQSGKVEDTSHPTVLAVSNSWMLITKKAGGRLNTGLSPANRRSAPALLKKIIPKKRKMSR